MGRSATASALRRRLPISRRTHLSYGSPDGADGTDVQVLPDGLVVRFAAMPPTVRVAEGTPAALTDETVRVIQAINAALPREWQIRFSPEPLAADTPAPADGEILITFAAQADWPSEAVPPVDEGIGLAEPRYGIAPTADPAVPWSIEIVAGRVWVDPSQTGGQERLGVIAHELIHLLGRNHVDPGRFPALPHGGGRQRRAVRTHSAPARSRGAAGGVRPARSRQPRPTVLRKISGPWSDISMHVRGALGTEGGEIAFGAALRNGLSQPWAAGPTPNSDLEDNTALSGNVHWSGRLLGFTPRAETVAARRRADRRIADLVPAR